MLFCIKMTQLVISAPTLYAVGNFKFFVFFCLFCFVLRILADVVNKQCCDGGKVHHFPWIKSRKQHHIDSRHLTCLWLDLVNKRRSLVWWSWADPWSRSPALNKSCESLKATTRRYRILKSNIQHNLCVSQYRQTVNVSLKVEERWRFQWNADERIVIQVTVDCLWIKSDCD